MNTCLRTVKVKKDHFGLSRNSSVSRKEHFMAFDHIYHMAFQGGQRDLCCHLARLNTVFYHNIISFACFFLINCKRCIYISFNTWTMHIHFPVLFIWYTLLQSHYKLPRRYVVKKTINHTVHMNQLLLWDKEFNNIYLVIPMLTGKHHRCFAIIFFYIDVTYKFAEFYEVIHYCSN